MTSHLTNVEQAIVALAAQGKTNREIGDDINLAETTVKNMMFAIFDKLGVWSRLELVLYALAHDIKLPPSDNSHV